MSTTAKKIKWNGSDEVVAKYAVKDSHGTDIDIAAITSLIPSEATSSNKLADKAFVNSSIATNTGNFLGNLDLVSDLGLTASATHSQVSTAIATYLTSHSISASNNDYVMVAYPDAVQAGQYTQFDRYKYNGSAWEWEYTLNNSSFTADQWAAINSTITAAKVSAYDSHVGSTSNPHNVTKSQLGLGNVDNTSDATKKLNFTGSVTNGNLGFVTGGAVYTALEDKVDKVTGKSLTTNDFTDNAKNKLDGIASGAQVNVIETIKVNGSTLTPSSKEVDITVPPLTAEDYTIQ